MKKSLGTVAVAAAMALSLSACGGSGSSAESAKGEISYWLWDANQLPAYQQCADDFTKANPDITVKITQRGWDDYWSTLTNGFVGGTARPDPLRRLRQKDRQLHRLLRHQVIPRTHPPI